MYLKPIHSGLSLLAAWLRLCYTMMLVMALSHLLDISLLTGSNSTSTVMMYWSTAEQAAVVMQKLYEFEMMWSLGLIVFGGHLLAIGVLALKATFIPRMIGLLVVIAAAGYILLHIGEVFFNQFEEAIAILEMLMLLPMTIGELGLAIWLLLRGGKLTLKLKPRIKAEHLS